MADDLETLRRRVAELEHERMLYRLVVESTPTMVWTTDADLRLLSWIGGGLKAVGVDPALVIGDDIYAFFGTTDVSFPPIDGHLRALRGESIEYEFEWNGLSARCHVEPLYDDAGEITGVVGVGIDRTERLRLQRGHDRMAAEIEELRQRLGILERVVHICGHCKRVRDERGRWQPVDAYLADAIPFNHTICPPCLDRLYPEPWGR